VNSRLRDVLLRLVGVIAVVCLGMVLFQDLARHLEAGLAVATLQLFGSDRVRLLADSSVLVVPGSGSVFRVVVTPSCSALSAVLAIGALGVLTPKSHWLRRVGATSLAVTAVIVGNWLRITSSLAAGVWTGSGSLVLFHDSIGTACTFASILGGYVLMLYLLLPDRRPPDGPRVAAPANA
jgi:exosortase/archaeosortase family protein